MPVPPFAAFAVFVWGPVARVAATGAGAGTALGAGTTAAAAVVVVAAAVVAVVVVAAAAPTAPSSSLSPSPGAVTTGVGAAPEAAASAASRASSRAFRSRRLRFFRARAAAAASAAATAAAAAAASASDTGAGAGAGVADGVALLASGAAAGAPAAAGATAVDASGAFADPAGVFAAAGGARPAASMASAREPPMGSLRKWSRPHVSTSNVYVSASTSKSVRDSSRKSPVLRANAVTGKAATSVCVEGGGSVSHSRAVCHQATPTSFTATAANATHQTPALPPSAALTLLQRAGPRGGHGRAHPEFRSRPRPGSSSSEDERRTAHFGSVTQSRGTTPAPRRR